MSGSLFSGVISEKKYVVQKEYMIKTAGQKLAAIAAEDSKFYTVITGDETIVKRISVGKLK